MKRSTRGSHSNNSTTSFAPRVRLDVSSWQMLFGAVVLGGLAAVLFTPTASLAQPDLTPPANPLPEAGEVVQEEGVETLTQGPIHEAFANPTDLDPTPGPVVSTQPPADIAEDSPEFMPEDSFWIPGYWIWDEERDDFIWVTGVARKIPPGQRYIPGYWIEVEGGFQRVSGFWASAETEELEYREPPPETLETGPSSPAPAENHFWVPGTWNYYDTGYRWRAGYWSPYQPDWVWVPARWAWTPAGCVYLPGFWDYRLSYRGTMFAPVYFTQPIYTRPNWSYRPWCTIPTSNLFIHLCVRPNYGHYYYGNYYGPRYASFGFNSWCNFPTRRYHYDPFFTYCNVHYRRQGVDFIGRVRGWHDHYDRHVDRRPPRTWREQQTFLAQRDNRVSAETQLIAHNIKEVARRDDTPLKLARVDDRKRQAITERTGRIHELNTARKQVERESATLVQLPRGVDSRPGREGAAGTGKGSDNRPAGKGKAGDRAPNDDDRPGKSKGDDDKGAKRGDRDDRPGDKSKDGDRPAGKGKADDRDSVRDKGGDDRQGKGRDDGPGNADRGGKSPALIDRVDGAKKGPGTARPKLKLPQEPGATGRSGGVRPPAAESGGKRTAGQRDTIPPPMPGATEGTRPAPPRGTERPSGDRGTGRDVFSPPGSKGKGSDRNENRGSPSGGQTETPRPRLPGVESPASDAGRPAKGGKAKVDLPGGSAPRPGGTDRSVPRGSSVGDRPGGATKGTGSRLEERPTRPPSGSSRIDSPRTEIPRPNRPSFDVPKSNRPSTTPRPENRPRVEANRVEVPTLERPREVPRIQSVPRIEAPRPAPRIESPRPAPRIESPRPAPRIESPRSAPRIEAPRPAPRIETPRPAPRIEAPRPAPRLETPQTAPRAESPRSAPRGKASRTGPRADSTRAPQRTEPSRS